MLQDPLILDDVAIVINPKKDNVAVVMADRIEQGVRIRFGDDFLTLSSRAARGQSFAIKDIPEGAPFVSLGDPIGLASAAVRAGDPVNETNIQRRLPHLVVRYRDHPEPPLLDPELARLTFDGYVRNDGSVGVRNLIGVVASGMCSSSEVREIATRAMREIYTREKFPNVDGVVPIVHDLGCGTPDGSAVQMLNRLLANTLRHPNLGAAVYVDLGCGKTCVECSEPVLRTAVPDYDRRVATLTIQREGGSRKTVERGLEIVERLLHDANRRHREPAPVSKLIIGTECGGSDRWSGVTANPAVGVASDMFVKAGAAVFLPEIPELQGSAMVDLVRRARTRTVGKKLMRALKRYEAYVKRYGEDIRDNPSPGNIQGGLYNIYLKSSGVKAKGGTSIVEGLVEYGEWLGDRKGLYVLYTPGYDPICTPALFLSGAQIALFTTGLGTSLGCALGPVMKIGSNPQLALSYEDLDINAGTILERKATIEEVGRKIFQETLDVASGRKFTRAEASGFHHEFNIWEQLWPAL